MSKLSAAIVLGACALSSADPQQVADNPAVDPEPKAGFLPIISTPMISFEKLQIDTQKLNNLSDIKVPSVAEIESQIKSLFPENGASAYPEIDGALEKLNGSVKGLFEKGAPPANLEEFVSSLNVDLNLEKAFSDLKAGNVATLEEAIKGLEVEKFKDSIKESLNSQSTIFTPTKQELDETIREAVDEISQAAGAITGDKTDGASLLADMLKGVDPQEIVENIKQAVASIDVPTPEVAHLEDMTAVISPEIVKEAIEEMVADLTKMSAAQ